MKFLYSIIQIFTSLENDTFVWIFYQYNSCFKSFVLKYGIWDNNEIWWIWKTNLQFHMLRYIRKPYIVFSGTPCIYIKEMILAIHTTKCFNWNHYYHVGNDLGFSKSGQRIVCICYISKTAVYMLRYLLTPSIWLTVLMDITINMWEMILAFQKVVNELCVLSIKKY